MINWAYYPRNQKISELGLGVVNAFKLVAADIDSASNDHLISVTFKDSGSDIVLSKVRPGLVALGFQVEEGKKRAQKISVPVMFGKNGVSVQSFEADAYHEPAQFVVEVEAGRAVTNYQFLKDLFEACVMVDVDYLCIALRNVYKGAKNFDTACTFIDTLYAGGRLVLPLKGVLLIGY